jgi:hypothetical protein
LHGAEALTRRAISKGDGASGTGASFEAQASPAPQDEGEALETDSYARPPNQFGITRLCHEGQAKRREFLIWRRGLPLSTRQKILKKCLDLHAKAFRVDVAA